MQVMNINIPDLSPPLWARNGHLQTLAAHFLPPKKTQSAYQEVFIPLADGDQVVTSYYPGSKPVVIYLFHGLSGNRFSDYMLATVLLAQNLGYHCYSVSLRGSDPLKGKSKLPWHSGRSKDLSDIIAYGKAHHIGFKHVAISFSSSANALLCLLGGKDGNSLPDYAIASNAPLDLEKCSILLTKKTNRLYDLRFLIRLRNIIKLNINETYKYIQSSPYKTTLRDFDNEYTAPVCGFKNREDYYQQCSAAPFLKNIKTPTVLIHASDDPFVDFSDYQKISNPMIKLNIQKNGGHVGYIDKSGKHWLFSAIEKYLLSFLS